MLVDTSFSAMTAGGTRSLGLYALFADGVLVLHTFYVLFVIGGLLLILIGWWRGWSWTRGWWFRLAHLAAIGFVVLEAWWGVTCPLTVLESNLRVHAGQAGYATGFVSDWLRKLIFYQAADWVFTVLYTVFALLVIIVFVYYPPRRYPSRHD